MLENLRQFIFGLQLRQFRLIGLVIPSDAQCQIEICIEVVGHDVAVVVVVRHGKVTDVEHDLACPFRNGPVCSNVIMVDIFIDKTGLFREGLEIRFDQIDVDGTVTVLCDGEFIPRISLLEPLRIISTISPRICPL